MLSDTLYKEIFPLKPATSMGAFPSDAVFGRLPLLTPESVFIDGMRHHHIANTAYPIGHNKTYKTFLAGAQKHEEIMARELRNSEAMSLYAHIPFCQTRCKFCEYTVIANPSLQQQDEYHLALMKELELYISRIGLKGKRLAGFDIGGGTPALVEPGKIRELVETVKANFTLEPGFGISIETTPLIAARTPEKLEAYRKFGIDRISMGLQSISPALLRTYERDIHETGFNGPAVNNIRKAGYREFNIDLMYGFAAQTPDDFALTVKATISLAPDVITLYRMRYKGTRVAEEAQRIDYQPIHEMYDQAYDILQASGYHANPGKNTFAREGHFPGTSPYLTSRVVEGLPYLGIGLGAQSFSGGMLAYNLGAATKKLDGYLSAISGGRLPIQDLYDLPAEEGMAKMAAVSFYFGEIDLSAFRKRFGKSLEEAYPEEVAFVLKNGYMAYAGNKLRLTKDGAAHFPGVIALFYSDAVKAHLHRV